MSDPDVGPNAQRPNVKHRNNETTPTLKAPGFPGGGAFSDVLTPDLARALLGNEEGLNIARIANWPESIRPHHSMFFHQILGLVGGTYNIGNIKQMEKSEVLFNSCF